MLLAAIKVRGNIKVNRKIKDTMNMLRLTRVNHCVLIPDSPEYKGMLQKAKDYITWGPIDPKTLKNLIIKRGKLLGGAPLSPSVVKKNTPYENISSLVKAISDEKFLYRDIENISPIFRLAPPVKGYEGIKRTYVEGGALGNRGKDINSLIVRML